MTMDKKPIYISLLCLMLIFSGCGKKTEDTSDSKQGSTIVTGKIALSPPSASENKSDAPFAMPDPEMAVLQEEDAQALEQEPVEKEQEQMTAISTPLEEKPAQSSNEDYALVGRKSLKASYDPTGKVDPFKPLFTEAPTMDTSSPAQKRKKRKPMTPLERVDLSQLKLVGIVRSDDKDRALVEEINGKGYIIKEGTYIGTNSGKVVQILRDRIIVEEEIENVLGNISLQKRELKLQKPLGEE